MVSRISVQLYMTGPGLRWVVSSTAMPPADFCQPIPATLDAGSLWQIDRSPRVMLTHLRAYARPHIRPYFPCKYRALKIVAFLPGTTASYTVPVRQAGALPAAPFRFHLAVGTLAVRLTVPPAGPVEDSHLQVIQFATTSVSDSASQGAARHAWRTNLQVGAPCRAHPPKKRSAGHRRSADLSTENSKKISDILRTRHAVFLKEIKLTSAVPSCGF